MQASQYEALRLKGEGWVKQARGAGWEMVLNTHTLILTKVGPSRPAVHESRCWRLVSASHNGDLVLGWDLYFDKAIGDGKRLRWMQGM